MNQVKEYEHEVNDSYEEKNSKLFEFLFGYSQNIKTTIIDMVIGAAMIAILQIIGYFLNIQVGPMVLRADTIFYMAFGVLFGAVWGSVFAIISDTLETLVFHPNAAGWLWQFAILAPLTVIISSAIKTFIWKREKGWLIGIIATFVIADIAAISTLVYNLVSKEYKFRADHDQMILLIEIMIPIMVAIQVVVLVLFVFKSDNIYIKKAVNVLALSLIVVAIISLMWSPYAVNVWLNKSYDTHHSLSDPGRYSYLLIPRLLKYLPEVLIYSTVMYGIVTVFDIVIPKLRDNRW